MNIIIYKLISAMKKLECYWMEEWERLFYRAWPGKIFEEGTILKIF